MKCVVVSTYGITGFFVDAILKVGQGSLLVFQWYVICVIYLNILKVIWTFRANRQAVYVIHGVGIQQKAREI